MPGSFSQEDVSIEAPLLDLVTNTLTGYRMLRHFVRPVTQQLDVWVHAQKCHLPETLAQLFLACSRDVRNRGPCWLLCQRRRRSDLPGLWLMDTPVRCSHGAEQVFGCPKDVVRVPYYGST